MKTQILPSDPTSLQLAKKALEKNDLVAIPTETVYGLAANAFSDEAILKVYQTKSRPKFDPCIVHFNPINFGQTYLDWTVNGLTSHASAIVTNTASILAKKFWPGPLTLILPRGKLISDLVTSGMPRVALRVPEHPLTLELLSLLDFPLIAPSANPFGRISPTSAFNVYSDFNGKIPYILDGGNCKIGIESTVLLIDSVLGLEVLRPGAVSLEMIQDVLVENNLSNEWGKQGGLKLQTHTPDRPISPGQLTSHYAPLKTLFRIERSFLETSKEDFKNFLQLLPSKKIAFLISSLSKVEFLDKYRDGMSDAGLIWELPATKGAHFVAQNLFSTLRQMDESQADVLVCETFKFNEEDASLGFAILDRLQRASTVLTPTGAP